MAKHPNGKSNVVPMRMTAAKAQAKVRALAAESGNIIWSKHVRQRMEERGIDAFDVLNILRKGTAEGETVDGEKPGEVKLKITRMTGGREAGVVVALVSDHTKIKLVTTEWEDLT